MGRKRFWIVGLILVINLGWMPSVKAQSIDLSNQKKIRFSSTLDTICLDSLTAIPGSIQVFQKDLLLDSTSFTFFNNCLILRKRPYGKSDSLDIYFRALPIDLDKHYRWIDSVEIGHKIQEIDIAFDLTEEESNSILPNMRGLDYQGSFARGLTLGNNQSLVLNSSFNLQMSGRIANDLEIKAAITDENIPIQPEGNTQELREFDKIFIQLSKGNSSLTAGDYELKSQEGYFLKYHKKLQGVTAATNIKLGGGNLSTRASVAIPKGQFVRNNLVAIEGNQGPYALQGKNGERFLIIQSATEKVFLDGRLLKRGIDEDYVIDYNRGVVTFMPRNMITKDRRIIVEFEYADQKFQRSMMALDADWKRKNWKVYFNFITQRDSKLSGGARDLSKEEKLILAQAGDNIAQAFVSGIDTLDEYSPDLVAYEMVDTLGFLNVLRYSTDKNKKLFRARFSEVGADKGHYVISQSAANGRVYKWVAPDDMGRLQGNFEPVIPLVAPESHQIFSFGTQATLLKKLTLTAEMSLSQKDINRFSDLDKKDDVGLAAKINLEHRWSLGMKKSSPSLQTTVGYQWVESKYKSFNPFRKTEFSRDWNVENQQARTSEFLPNISMNYIQPKWGNIRYDYSGYIQENRYDGKKHSLSFDVQRGRVRWTSNGSILTSKSDFERTEFMRGHSDLAVLVLRKLGKKTGRLGVIVEIEDNQRFIQNAVNQQDTLAGSSQKYNFYKLYFDFPSGDKFQSGVFVSQRKDFVPGRLVNPFLRKQFLQSTEALDIAWKGKWNTGKQSRLNWQFTRRHLSIVQKSLTTLQPQNTWLGRLGYNFRLPKGLLVSTTNYELGSGQAPKLEYNYLKVDPGQGSYTWVDRNKDSIPQLDEFEVAPFADQANFLRVSIVTNEFVETNNIRFNQSIRINPRNYLASKSGILKFISRFSTINSWRMYRRLKVIPEVEAWNPFAQAIDSALVTTESAMLNTLYYNRGNPKFEWQLGQKSNQNKSLLTSGGESRKRSAYFSKLRYRINHSVNLELEGEQGALINDAELFTQRNYYIREQNGKLAVTHIFNRRIRNVLSYAYTQKENQIGEHEVLESHELKWAFTLTGKPNPLGAQRPTRLRVDMSIVKINFESAVSTPVGFTMLEGLQPGQNLLWGLTVDKQITKSVILSLLYNGRKTGTIGKIIHVGSMQARALF